MNKKFGGITKVTVSIVFFFFLLAICEVIVRMSGADTYYESGYFVINRDLDYPDVTLRDSDLFWKLRPNCTITSEFFDGDTIRTNSLGFRDKEFASSKTLPRIVALGNSCTFGWGVETESTFTELLKNELNRNFEVINAGIPGYSSYQGRVLFEKEIEKLKPDIVLILFAWNDHWPAAIGISDKEQQFPAGPIVHIQNRLLQFHAYRLLRKMVLSITENKDRPVMNNNEIIYRVNENDFIENLKAICDGANGIAARPILMTSPMAAESEYNSSSPFSSLRKVHSTYNQLIRDFANENKIELVDLAAEFENRSGLFDKPTYDPIHFNANGHKIAAHLLAVTINSL